MTFNQIIKRIEGICLAHNQVSNFYYGMPTDFLNDKKTLFASCFLQDNPGVLDMPGKTDTIGFKLFALDLVHVSQDSKSNELDVLSDMRSIIKDIIAEINHSSYTDWKVSSSNTITLVREQFNDLVAGSVIDFSILQPYDQDVCAVPTSALPEPGIINTDNMKPIYDNAYTATGSEGSTLSIPELVGKKILLIIRGSFPIHKVLSSPGSSEYTWNDTDINLGAVTVTNERFLILYRNY